MRTGANSTDSVEGQEARLEKDEYLRYGRQLIVPEIGILGQHRLRKARVLVIGAGGLGCPALAYLAGAGVGKLGIVDNDTVEASNLHRQILHNTSRVGMSKALSAEKFINELNPFVDTQTYVLRFVASNAFDIAKGYDLILDCTDTPATRYLVNDVAVILGVPLISASALKTDGQLSVLNYKGGPCYRCLFPIPPPPSSVTSCGDGGILGPVVGIMGVQQATEAIKVITGAYDKEFKPFLMIYSAYSFPPVRCVSLRGRKATCAVCGDAPSICQDSISRGEVDYAEFCGTLNQSILSAKERVSAKDYNCVDYPHTLLDVRDEVQYNICSLKNSINVPLKTIQKQRSVDKRIVEPVFVVCRYGNDSQAAVRILKEKFGLDDVYDIVGGLNRWASDVDPDFPVY